MKMKNKILLIIATVFLIAFIFTLTPVEQEMENMRLPEIQEKSKYAVLEQIIVCESGENRLDRNPQSTATGIFQILKGTGEFCEKHFGRTIDREEVLDSWLCAKFLFDKYNLQPWEECKIILGL